MVHCLELDRRVDRLAVDQLPIHVLVNPHLEGRLAVMRGLVPNLIERGKGDKRMRYQLATFFLYCEIEAAAMCSDDAGRGGWGNGNLD